MIARKWRLLIGAAATLGAVVLAVLYAALGAYVYLEPTLPSAATLRGQNRLVPLRIYTRDGALISQFGEQLRVPVRYEDIPVILRNAVLSAEDKRFFQHSGFDPVGVIRAAWVDVRRGSNKQGASTLSMQLARTMFLNQSRTWKRKAAEVMITLQLEQKLTKEQIQTRESRYLFPVACGLYAQFDATKDLENSPSAEYVTGELERLAEAVILVIDQDAFTDASVRGVPK